ncbi:MAG: hypothetical protein O3B42_00790 [Actinomycetota bacterium]|nr:hypothetical protein [Actinomycetota bacterium]
MENMSEDPLLMGERPLRERLPDYAGVFVLGLAASALAGILYSVVFDSKMTSSVGNVIMFYGVILMFIGGATGGGYTSIGAGAARALFTTRTAIDDPIDEPREVDPIPGKPVRMDPREQMRQGLRPEANPTSFWQVIGGISYLIIGFLIL